MGRFYGIIVLGKNFGEIFVCRRRLGKEVFVIGKFGNWKKSIFVQKSKSFVQQFWSPLKNISRSGRKID